MDTLLSSVSSPPPRPQLPERPRSSLQLNKDYVFGLLLLGIVVILWTLSNFITQALFQNGFQKPFLVTYLNTSSFTIYLLPFLWRRLRGTVQNPSHAQETRYQVVDSSHRPLIMDPQLLPGDGLSSSAEHNLPPLSIRETRDLAFAFCFLWFIANWSVNASLFYTSVASATILSSMSGLFTLAIGRIFMVEILTTKKIFAVILSFGGVLLVSLSDSSSSKDPSLPGSLYSHATHAVLGDSLALISALFYALYATFLKVRIHSESRIDMQLFFGFVGLYNILVCWVIGVILHVSALEVFELPKTSTAIEAILFNMFITFTSDYLYVLSMLKTTPLVVTVGLSLTIPLAVVGDLLLMRPVRAQVLTGAFLVLISFLMVGMNDSRIRFKQVELRDSLVVQ